MDGKLERILDRIPFVLSIDAFFHHSLVQALEKQAEDILCYQVAIVLELPANFIG